MTTMNDLLERLVAAGIPLGDSTKSAMEMVDPSEFTDYNLEPFWHDRPVPFLFTEFGATRTISAPHMIATLLHHLEVREGQHILLIGSKGGYLAAIIDHVVGEGGAVTIIEQHEGVDRGDTAIDDLDPAIGIGVLQHRLQEVGERGLRRIGKTEQGRGAQCKDAESIVGLVASEAILPGGQARILMRKEAPGGVGVEPVGLALGDKEFICGADGQYL